MSRSIPTEQQPSRLADMCYEATSVMISGIEHLLDGVVWAQHSAKLLENEVF